MKVIKEMPWEPLAKECPLCHSTLLIEEEDVKPLWSFNIKDNSSPSEPAAPSREFGVRCPICNEKITLSKDELPYSLRKSLSPHFLAF